jgi:hypothetical protein
VQHARNKKKQESHGAQEGHTQKNARKTRKQPSPVEFTGGFVFLD